MKKNAHIVVGLGFGDEGKGSFVSSLCETKQPSLVVRFNGGAQAAHTVRVKNQQHTFRSFGSGTLQGVSTLIARDCLVDPTMIYQEATELEKHLPPDVLPEALLIIDPRCSVVTEYHKILNKAREAERTLLAGEVPHGSCGMGIGETVKLKSSDFLNITVGDIANTEILRDKLQALRDYALAELMNISKEAVLEQDLTKIKSKKFLEDHIIIFQKELSLIQIAYDTNILRSMPGDIVFEGAQGALLDQEYGFHPHNTWSRTTKANAIKLIAEAVCFEETTTYGAMRAYQTRHGFGPLPTESDLGIEDLNNPSNPFQGAFRFGHIDIPLLDYAIHQANKGIDKLAISCWDQIMFRPAKICHQYDKLVLRAKPSSFSHQENLGVKLSKAKPKYLELEADEEYIKLVAHLLDTPIGILSVGPDTESKQYNI